ncbi:MAG TPA: glycosyltransferase family 2 protein [Ruminococcus sp.]|nr:glycosyltransferase family 2 protein [Ruminococcus sp.]
MVSVIIPSYNREKTIKRAVDSVFNQTYNDLEVIVVDDCSTDKTIEVLASIKDDRFSYYKLDMNSGACVARNLGIEKAKGDYIAFQDSDDEWLPDKLEKQMKAFDNKDIDVVFCPFNKVVNQKTEIHPVLPEGIVNRDALLGKSCVSTQTLIAKKECFDKIKFDPLMPRMQDYDITIRLSEKYTFYFVNKPLVNMYVQGDSISKNKTKLLNAEIRILSKYQKEAAEFPAFRYYNIGAFGAAKRACKFKAKQEYKALYKIKPSVKNLLKYIFVAITDISRKSYKSFID